MKAKKQVGSLVQVLFNDAIRSADEMAWGVLRYIYFFFKENSAAITHESPKKCSWIITSCEVLATIINHVKSNPADNHCNLSDAAPSHSLACL